MYYVLGLQNVNLSLLDSMPSVLTDINHSYIPISNYICTLTWNCFDIVSSGTEGSKSIATSITHRQEILMVQKIKITEKCRYPIIDLIHKCEKQSERPIDVDKAKDKIVLEVRIFASALIIIYF